MSNGTESAVCHVAYLGPQASFSNQAALNIFPSDGAATVHPLSSFSAICAALQALPGAKSQTQNLPSVTYDYAVLPVENSTNGSVVQVYDLLVQLPTLYPDLEIIAEYYLPVHHYLFVSPYVEKSNGHQESSGPQSTVRTIYTHPQVWGQCTRYLHAHFPGTERIDCSSTSAAAQLVTSDTIGTVAAISSQLAGATHSLRCLASNIEDEPGKNTTRFFVVRNRKRSPAPFTYGPTFQPDQEMKYKSMIAFTVPHTQPGSLADALAVFKQFHFNLTSIDTRPSKQRNWHYVFFVECEESRKVDDDQNLKDMLQELQQHTENVSCLGSWRDMLQDEKLEQEG